MKYLLITAAFLLGTFVFPAVSHAQVFVDFETTPLFGQSNFIPGDTVSKTVTVKNEYSEAKNVYTELLNIDNSDGLGDAIDVEISGGDISYAGTFTQFDTDNRVLLTNLSPEEEVLLTYKMTFKSDAGNTYQNKSLGFDICVGLDGGQFDCDDNAEPDDGDDGGNNDGGGGGGDDDDDTPDDDVPGEVEGASTTPTTFFGSGGGFPFEDFIGEVFGAETSADDAAITTGSEPVGLVASVSSAGAAMLADIDCLILWLILLVVISLSWSIIEDRLGKHSGLFGQFFTRNAVFTIAYIAGLIIFELLGILDIFWWVFAGIWTVMTGFDYWSHKKIADFWNPRRRNLYFATIALAFAAVGLFTPLLCVWVPFVIIMLVSTLLLFLDE